MQHLIVAIICVVCRRLLWPWVCLFETLKRPAFFVVARYIPYKRPNQGRCCVECRTTSLVQTEVDGTFLARKDSEFRPTQKDMRVPLRASGVWCEVLFFTNANIKIQDSTFLFFSVNAFVSTHQFMFNLNKGNFVEQNKPSNAFQVTRKNDFTFASYFRFLQLTTSRVPTNVVSHSKQKCYCICLGRRCCLC